MASDELGPELLPEDVNERLRYLMAEKYALFMSGRAFDIRSSKDFHRVTVRVTLSNDDESFVYPVYGRLDFEAEEMKAEEAALFLVDYIDSYFENFFEEGEALYIPIEWAPYEYDAIEFEMRGQILNLKAERLADKLLAEHPIH